MKSIPVALVLTLFSFAGYISGQTINAGNDTTICAGGTATLTASVTGGTLGTSSYTFQIIPYQPLPFSGGNQIDPEFTECSGGAGHDDCWAGPYEIGFNFCFFNENYTQFYIGSNGWIGFTNPAGQGWTTFTSQPIPNTNPSVPKNCIMAPWEDWQPTISVNNVFYYLTGTPPNRKLVIYWLECPMYGCNNLLGTFQIVINEETSIIENHIANKPICGGNTSTQGVHNLAGTVAFTATGRNSTVWTATNESTRFVPSSVVWYTGGYPGGTVVGSGLTITKSPTVTTEYTAVVETCGGNAATDNVTVFVIDATFSYPQPSYCRSDPNPNPTVLQPGGTFSSAPAGLVFESSSTGIINLSASTAGTYTVTYTITNGSCTNSKTWPVTINNTPNPPIAVADTVSRCGPGNVTLSVVPVTGVSITWYDAATGGNLLPTTGPTINVNVAATTSYFAQATTNSSSCSSLSRTRIVAQVKPIPAITNTLLLFSQCSATSTNISLLASVPGTSFSWSATAPSSLSGFSGGTGSMISQIIYNSGTTVDTVYYTVTPTATGCPGNSRVFRVAVKPVPNLSNTPLTTSICSGQVLNLPLQSNVLGTTFTWSCTQTSGNISGYSPNAGPGTTAINQTLTLSGVVKDSVIYHLTPQANNCDGSVTDYKVIVNPVPSLTTSPMVDSICSEATTDILLTATCTGTSFNWSAAQGVGSVTGSSDGTGNLITQQLTDPLSAAGSILYTISPSTSTCMGLPEIFTQWVKPLPHLTNQPKGDSVCSGQVLNLPLQSDVTNTWFTWSTVGSSPFITGFSDQTTPTTLLDQTLINSGFDIEWATYLVAPTAAGCHGPDSTFVVTVFPVPDMSNDPPSLALCSGQSTGVTLTSHVSGTQFTWTAVGSSLFVSGFSDQPAPTTILDQTLVNSGDDIETVTYTITPSANDCDGIDTSFVVTVYPVPDLATTPLAKEICNNNATNIVLTSNISGTLFTWTAIGSSPFVTGFSDNTTTPVTLIDQNLVNSGSVNETVTYRIVPHANGCLGDTVDYIVTVVPSPYLTNNPLTQNQCNNVNTALTLESNVAGTQFTWTATGSSANVSGYSNSVAPGILINQTLVNSGFSTEIVTFHVTPVNSGCPGSVTDYTVTVFPVPDVLFVPNGETVCEGNVSNLSLQSHVTGTTFSWTATPSSPNPTGYSDGSGDLIAQTIDNAGATIETVTYSVTPEANGCPPGMTMPVVLTVNPRPAVTAAPGGQAICNGATTGLTLMADVSGSTFAWRAFGNSVNVTGFSNGSGGVITQTLMNSGFTIDTVTYRVAGTANGCTGDSSDFKVIVYPVADVLFTPASQNICSGQTTSLTLQSNVPATSFTWTATGSTGNVSGYSGGSGTLIQQTLTNTGYMMPTVTYLVTPTANSCIGTQNSAVVTVNPLPVVSMTVCFDTLTTVQAQPFVLKGAIPPGGLFSGPGGGSVSWLTGSTFHPAMADTGVHHIRYTYTNDFGCLDSASLTIHIADPVSHICGDTVTDIRDGQRYPTVLIGSQCWMANNLNFGTMIPSSQIQRDNCIPEKYCYNDNPALCALGSVLYQWDEAMRYTADNAAQGFCPPGWHIPTEADWTLLFTNFISNGFAGNALKASGYSGFNALMTGIRFQNLTWKFPANDPILRSKLYWSSSIHGLNKAWAHGMNEVVSDIEYTPSVSFYPALISNNFAVRCVRD